MQDLRLIGVHEDGEHLVFGAEDGTEFRAPLDEALGAAVRQAARTPAGTADPAGPSLRPRDVQALIRAGVAAEDAAERAGWPLEKVVRYQSPILAEREHVARLARTVVVRGRTSRGAPSPTLETRVRERLIDRGVNLDSATWDAARPETGPWRVVVDFVAGQRDRQASWHFDPSDRTIVALDDEARWLSEDEQTAAGGPVPSTLLSASSRTTHVYDVEAEGGLRPSSRRADRGQHPAGTGDPGRSKGPARGDRDKHDEPVDLMTAMRERSAAARGRRRAGGRKGRNTPSSVPVSEEQVPEEVLPLENLPYDPETMGLPPAAHGRPGDEADEGNEADEGDESDESPEPAEEPRGAGPAATEDAQQEEELPLGTGAADADSDDEEANLDDFFGDETDDEADGETDGEADDETPAAEPADAEEQPAGPARAGRRKGRPSVPSWDDIMFGARDRDR